MGCCSSKKIDATTRDDMPAEPKLATNATSPETNISTARSEHSLRMALPAPETSVFGSDVQVSLPTGMDITQLKSSGRAATGGETMSIEPLADRNPKRRSTDKTRPHTFVGGFNPPEIPGRSPFPPLPPARSRRASASTQPDQSPKSRLHSSRVMQSAPDGSLPASTNPQRGLPLEINEIRGLASANGKLSKRVDALDRTGQLTGRTKPMFQRSFSDVSQAKLGDRVVAVKALRLTNIESPEQSQILKRLPREIYVWATLDHPNVLELLGYSFDDEIPCLISPWCENGTLREYLRKFPNANRRRLVREIAEGLRYLHEQTPPIIHGDLKMTNVFITDEHAAKISDFGTFRLVEQLRTGLTTSGSVPATTRHSAPEILRGGQEPALCSDVFSFACLALETMTDKCPFWKIPNDMTVVMRVAYERQTPSLEDHPGMEDAIWVLLRRCWNYEPSDRPQMADVCKMLSAAGYGSSTGFYPPPRAGPSYPSTRFDRPGRGSSTV